MPRIPAILDLTHTSSVSAPSSNPCYFALRDSSLGTFSSRSVLHESRLAQAASCYTTAGSLLSGHFALRDSWLSCSSNVGTSHFVLHDSWLPATSCYTTAGSVFGHFVLHDSWPRPFRATRHLAHFQATENIRMMSASWVSIIGTHSTSRICITSVSLFWNVRLYSYLDIKT